MGGNVLKKIKDYILLLFLGVLVFLGIHVFENICKFLNITIKIKHIAWLWLTVVVSFLVIYAKEYKRKLFRVKIILIANTIFLVTLYTYILLYLDKLGYQVIPTVTIRSWLHSLGLIFVIFIINEQILAKLNKKNKRDLTQSK